MEIAEIVLMSCVLGAVVCCAVAMCYHAYTSGSSQHDVTALRETLHRIEDQIHAIDDEVLGLKISLGSKERDGSLVGLEFAATNNNDIDQWVAEAGREAREALPASFMREFAIEPVIEHCEVVPGSVRPAKRSIAQLMADMSAAKERGEWR